jgi:hypothetical protein
LHRISTRRQERIDAGHGPIHRTGLTPAAERVPLWPVFLAPALLLRPASAAVRRLDFRRRAAAPA